VVVGGVVGWSGEMWVGVKVWVGVLLRKRRSVG
jgi:hypothetical protein